MNIVRIRLQPLSPFRLDLIAWALRRRPRNLIDHWDGETYSRILTVAGTPLHLAIRQIAPRDRPEIECVYSCADRIPGKAKVITALQRLLGLNVDTTAFERLAATSARLGALVANFAGFRPPRFPTVFEAAVNAICCQQLSLEAGLEMLNRLSSRTGFRFKGDGEALFGPPEPRRLRRLAPCDLRKLGFSRNKSEALLDVASLFARDADRFEDLADIDDHVATDRLMQLKGIGRWSAEYVLLRGLGKLSVFPGDDIAAAKSLRHLLGIRGSNPHLGYDEIHARLKKWDPFQGLVYFYLLLANLARRGWLDRPEPATVDRVSAPSASSFRP